MIDRNRPARTILLALLLFLLAAPAVHAQNQNPAVTITVDRTLNRHAINPNIYGIGDGVADSTCPAPADLNCPLNRMDSDRSTRYNWEENSFNCAWDWYFESAPWDTPDNATAGEAGDTFISLNKAAGAQPMLAIPMIGWVGHLGTNRTPLWSFSIAQVRPAGRRPEIGPDVRL